MASRYWVGGTGTWDATTTNWSATSGGAGGASAPTSADDVYFDSASNATAYTVTLSGTVNCKSVSIVGPASGNVTFANVTATWNIYGNLTVAATGITWSLASTPFTFKSTSTGNTITTNGFVLGNSLVFDGVGGSWILQDNYTTGPTRACTLTNGTFDLNSKILSVGVLNSNNSNARTLAFGASGQITLTGNNTTIFNSATVTNLTITGNKQVSATYSGATGTRTINPGALSEAMAFSLNVTGGTDIITSDVAPDNYTNLDFTGFKGTLSNIALNIYGDLTLDSGMTLSAGTSLWTLAGTSGSNTVTTNGKTLDFPVTVSGLGSTWTFADSLTLGATRTLTLGDGTMIFTGGITVTAGTFDINGTCTLESATPGQTYTFSQSAGTVDATKMTISDNIATGGATWNARIDDETNSNTDGGNNTGWTWFENIVPTVTRDVDGNPNMIMVQWEALSNAHNNGKPVKFNGYSIRSVQVAGNFGATGSVSMKGSNDGGVNYHTLTSNNSSAVTITSASSKKISEITQLVRPMMPTSDNDTDLTVSLLLIRKAKRDKHGRR